VPPERPGARHQASAGRTQRGITRSLP